MRKADLLGLPIAEPHPLPAEGKPVNLVACFRLHDVKGREVLSIDVFDATCQRLMHRLFIWEGDFITQSWQTDQQAWKWRTAMIEGAFGIFEMYRWTRSSYDYIGPTLDAESEQAVRAFFPDIKDLDAKQVIHTVARYQESIRANQLYRQHQRALAPVRKAMENVKPLPDGLENWIQNDLLLHDRYLYYKYSGRVEQTAYCSHCGNYVKMKGLRHNAACVCPSCGSEATALASGKTTKYSFTHTHHFSIIQKYGEDALITRRFEVHRQFTPVFSEPFPRLEEKTIWGEVIRDILRRENKEVQSTAYEWGIYKKNGRNGQSWIPYTDYKYMEGRVYPHGLRDELQGTWAQYSGLDAYANSPNGVTCIREDYYLQYWVKHPEIEMVAKGGMCRLASEIAAGEHYYYTESRFDMKTLKRHAKEIRQYNGGINSVRAFTTLDEAGKKTDPKEVIRFVSMTGDGYTGLPQMLRYASLKKINDYLAASQQRNIWDLRDLWGMLDTLGANMTENKTLFPRNLEKAHDEAIAQYNKRKDELASKKLERVAGELQKEFGFTFGGLMIVVPHGIKALQDEGKALNHCVRTYGERMARGETVILFVRKVEEPETSYFTMEVRDGKIIQLRGKNNCAPKEDVRKFEKEFCEHCHLVPRSA